ncbi:MAG: hypothetical protein WCW77_01965 [Patescibacteria group bacterium]|jgi:hypothetical protein
MRTAREKIDDFQPRQRNNDKKEIAELSAVLSGQSKKALSNDSLIALAPQRIFEIAADKKNVRVLQMPSEPGCISVMVVERDFPEELTNFKAWNAWQKDIKTALENKKSLPRAPEGVDRLHAKFSSKINRGDLQLDDRIFMACDFLIHPGNKEAARIEDFDGETHQGIGQDFYLNTLPDLARKLGLRYIVGRNNEMNLSFFKEALKRYTLDDVKPEFYDQLFPENAGDPYFTIQFLYDEDVRKYIKEASIKN